MTSRREIEEAQQVIAEKIRDLPGNFLDCRDPGLRHAWMRDRDFYVTEMTVGRRIASLAREEICDRCGARKIEKFINGRHGIEKVGQHYEYPEGYLLSGSGAPRGVKRSSIVWGENYRRAMEATVEEISAEEKRARKTL